jgi:hypothetical protein
MSLHSSALLTLNLHNCFISIHRGVLGAPSVFFVIIGGAIGYYCFCKGHRNGRLVLIGRTSVAIIPIACFFSFGTIGCMRKMSKGTEVSKPEVSWLDGRTVY